MGEAAAASDWHAIRAKHVGASEVAALFSVHPQISKFELFHRKAGNLAPVDLSADERVQCGIALESGIARLVAQKTGWKVRKVRRYTRHRSVEGMGASLDYEATTPGANGYGAVELKNVDWLERQKWGDEPPLSYQLQLQHQLACARRRWGAIGVLVGGNSVEVFVYSARPDVQRTLEAAVAAFWQSVRDGVEPPVVPEEGDGEILAQLHNKTRPGSLLDLRLAPSSPDPAVRDRAADLSALCSDYRRAKQQIGDLEDEAKLCKGLILRDLGETEKALLPDWTISAGASAGRRDFRVTRKGFTP